MLFISAKEAGKFLIIRTFFSPKKVDDFLGYHVNNGIMSLKLPIGFELLYNKASYF